MQRLLNAATLETAPLHRCALAWRAIVHFEACRGSKGTAAKAAQRALQFVPWSKVCAPLRPQRALDASALHVASCRRKLGAGSRWTRTS